jgi:hypothetical protein
MINSFRIETKASTPAKSHDEGHVDVHRDVEIERNTIADFTAAGIQLKTREDDEALRRSVTSSLPPAGRSRRRQARD